MSGKKILITGATGFVGSNLVNALLKEKTDTFTLGIISRDVKKTKEAFGDRVRHILYEDENFKSNIIDFSPDIVVHLASYSTSRDDRDSIEKLIDSNILFLSLLLDALKETEIKLFLNTGSFAEYYYNDGELNPAYYYAATKTASRAIVNYYKNITGMKCCTIIPYTIYGGINKNKKIIDLLFDSLAVEKPIAMTKGEQVSDFVHINDVLSFYIHILNNTHLLNDMSDYHLGSGQGITLREIAKIIEKISGKKTNIKWGKLDYRSMDMMRAIAPIYKLEKELGWIPDIDIEKGISIILSQKLSKKNY